MKKIIIFLVCVLTLGISTPIECQAQPQWKGNTLVSSTSSSSRKLDLQKTPYKKELRSGEVVDIYINPENGRCYRKRIDKEGKEQNVALSESDSKAVAQKMGISYTYQKKNRKNTQTSK